MNEYLCIAPDVRLGEGVKPRELHQSLRLQIGDGTKIGTFVEVQKNARIGKKCKISSHTFICEGVTIEDNVFVGHGVMFINDSYPRATAADGQLQTEKDWKVEPTIVRKGASIGSGATILANVTDRRKRPDRCRQRRNSGCSRQRDRGGLSCSAVAIYVARRSRRTIGIVLCSLCGSLQRESRPSAKSRLH